MSAAKPLPTALSTKGQVILPKAVREVLLREEDHPFAPTRFEEARGCLGGRAPSKTLEEIDAALRGAAKRRNARD